MSGIHHFELVIAKDSKVPKDSPVAVYLTDHAGTKIPSKGAQGTATILTGKSKVVVPLAAADQAQQATAGMVILAVFLEMTGEVIDACCHQRDLHLRRAGVALGTLIIGNNLRFLRYGIKDMTLDSLLKSAAFYP